MVEAMAGNAEESSKRPDAGRNPDGKKRRVFY